MGAIDAIRAKSTGDDARKRRGFDISFLESAFGRAFIQAQGQIPGPVSRRYLTRPIASARGVTSPRNGFESRFGAPLGGQSISVMR